MAIPRFASWSKSCWPSSRAAAKLRGRCRKTRLASAGPRPGSCSGRSRRGTGASTLLALMIMPRGIRGGGCDPTVSRREVVENSDFRKYDDNLRMTLDCTPALADRIEQRLTKAETDKVARFGLHRQPSAIMTCIVPSISESTHVHFVDGAAGGYSLAARRLKLN